MTVKAIHSLNGEKIPIREFKLEHIASTPAMVMIAKRGSGKSVLCKSILAHFKDIPAISIISPTERINPFFSSFISNLYIYDEYKSSLITRILYRQDKMKEKKLTKTSLDSRLALVMDDCLASKKSWMKDRQIMELLYNGRHYDITYILTMQYPLGIPPDLRLQFDYIFLLAEDNFSNQKRLYEHYCGIIPTFDTFRQIFSQLTEDHGCMVIINTNRHKISIDGPFTNKIFWYKADTSINLDTIGCDQYITFGKKNYDDEWKKKENKFDINEYCIQQKKNKGVVKVEIIKGVEGAEDIGDTKEKTD
jgi:hypothetical protein